MAAIMLRPDLRTAGGEVNDVMFNNRYVGTLTLVYRDADRIAGSLQLEKEVLSERDKDLVSNYVHEYVQALIEAMKMSECDVMVTHSSFDHVIATGEVAPVNEVWGISTDEDDVDYDWVDNETVYGDEGTDRDEVTMYDYELVVVGESRYAVEYHVYDADREWVAEAFMKLRGRDIRGTVDWRVDPDEQDLELVAELIVEDFDEDVVDSFVIDMKYEGEIIETLELTHEQLMDEENWEKLAEEAGKTDDSAVWQRDEEDAYHIVLVRDDGDMLTYEIYEPSRGAHPIGTATVDISQRQLTGFIDFRDPGTSDDREQIASLLMRELDKEKDFDTINLSMMHKNELIEELLFEPEQVH